MKDLSLKGKPKLKHTALKLFFWRGEVNSLSQDTVDKSDLAAYTHNKTIRAKWGAYLRLFQKNKSALVLWSEKLHL